MRVTRSTIGIYDPSFHISPLFVRLKPVLVRDDLVAVIGRMSNSGNRVSIYRIVDLVTSMHERIRDRSGPVRSWYASCLPIIDGVDPSPENSRRP